MTKRELLDELRSLPDDAQIYVYGVLSDLNGGRIADDVYIDDVILHKDGRSEATIVAHL